MLIIGSGLAGQSAALCLADAGLKVGLASKRRLVDSASGWAQGGIAAVLDSTDSVENHIADTLMAGAYLNDPAATRFAVEHASEAIQWLIDRGVPFTREAGRYHLTREGGHSHRRVIHVDDATGAAVQDTLTPQVRNHRNIHVMEHHIVVDLITSSKIGELAFAQKDRCLGAYVLDSQSGDVKTIAAGQTILATGGAGKVYLYTTNPDTSTGDGIAMAWRAGCRIANMEFIQFHPTCLYHPKEKSFLISEAVRGEGGLLKRPDGTRFMDDYDPRAELAPRDIVARAIDAEMKRHGLDCVYLDISHQPAEFIRAHFPTIYERCLQLGIDITKEPIPVVPAAHYTCGGVMIDQHGRTDLPGLYAAGEVTCSGLHGANRLGTNSLLDLLVFGKSSGDTVIESGDEVFIIAASSHIRRVMTELRRMDKPIRRIIIAGGGKLCAHRILPLGVSHLSASGMARMNSFSASSTRWLRGMKRGLWARISARRASAVGRGSARAPGAPSRGRRAALHRSRPARRQRQPGR